MKTIEIITHCYQYSRVLTYQLSSLLLDYPRTCRVIATVFYAREDEPTIYVLGYFRHVFNTEKWESRVSIRAWPLPKTDLFQRAIGRNKAALGTPADIVWFTDADYLFRDGCLDRLAALDCFDDADASPLWFPAETFFNHDHANGDEYARRAAELGVYDIKPEDFIPHRPGRAIGGVQIVSGDTAREFGYCPNHAKSQRPTASDEFLRCHSDRVYRKSLGSNGAPIDLPGVYRIRQLNTRHVDDLTC